MTTKIEQLNNAFRDAVPKWLAIHFVGFLLIAIVLGWGRPLKEILLIFVGVVVFLEAISLFANIIPGRLKHAALLEKYGDDYVDLALDAVEEVGVIKMFDDHWFYFVERELKDQAGARRN